MILIGSQISSLLCCHRLLRDGAVKTRVTVARSTVPCTFHLTFLLKRSAVGCLAVMTSKPSSSGVAVNKGRISARTNERG
jgi:hypothetical protein